jgi:D-alanyl-D-alanine endopeptidase (penicillin-binding protein 7)
MGRETLLKIGILAFLLVIFVAVFVQTRSEIPDGGRICDLPVNTGNVFGDAPDPQPPPLVYSSIYQEVTKKKRRRPSMRCQAALVVDNSNGLILYARNERRRRSIASLTKLMTAMVYLDTDPDLTRVLTITAGDARNSAKSFLRRGESFAALDMLHAALMSSDNRAARTLVRASGKTMEEFIQTMNEKAKILGLNDTHFEEVTGLSEDNVSTAYDCALLLKEALSYELIQQITTTHRYEFKSINKKRAHRATNSNRLVFSRHMIVGGKTGYILSSGWCLATRATDRLGHDITAIVLGAPTNHQRFYDADRALRWAFKNIG